MERDPGTWTKLFRAEQWMCGQETDSRLNSLYEGIHFTDLPFYTWCILIGIEVNAE